MASLGVAIAYGSLALTSFKGFADFAVIGAVGMLLCWGASFSLFPALVLLFGRNKHGPDNNLRIGAALARVFGVARPWVTCAVAGVLTVAAGAVVWRYAVSDPFEYNMKNLRSESAEAIESRHWMQTSDDNFGRGISGKTFIAADDVAQVPKIVTALRAIDTNTPEAKKTIGTVNSVLDVVPADQPRRLAVLAEIRKLLDDDALEVLDEKDRRDLRSLRPPDDLKPIALADLPQEIKDKLVEKDGRLGYMVAIRPAEKLDEWNGHDLLRFASAVRKLKLSDGATVTTSGSSVIFADIFASIQHDGPIVTLLALVGLIVMVLVVVGRDRPRHRRAGRHGAGQPGPDRRVRAVRPEGELPRFHRAAHHPGTGRRLRHQHRPPRLLRGEVPLRGRPQQRQLGLHLLADHHRRLRLADGQRQHGHLRLRPVVADRRGDVRDHGVGPGPGDHLPGADERSTRRLGRGRSRPRTPRLAANVRTRVASPAGGGAAV